MLDIGGFGDIVKVGYGVENRICAMKRIKYRGNFRDDPYITSEIYCLTHLKHKNVIQMIDLMIDEDEIDIVMEYAENGNLERYIKDSQHLECVTKIKIYTQVLQGVEYCHSMDIAHRDITPANILLTNDLVVKIADFGLAVKCTADDDSPVMCNDFLGRASYLAPEVLSQKPFLPKSTDIWSLGVTLLYLIFQVIPYKGLESDILKEHLQETWKDFVHEKSNENNAILKDCVIALLLNTLELDPKARWTMHDIVRMWDDVGPETYFVK